MNHRNLYHISLAAALILLFTQACGSGSKDKNMATATQVIDESEAVGTDDVPQEMATSTVEPTSTYTPTSPATSKPLHIESGSFEFEGQKREYMVLTPDTYSGSQKYPLVIYLHTHGNPVEDDWNNIELSQYADSHDFMVVYPRAIRAIWNSGFGDRIGRGGPDVNDVGFIDALIDTLDTNYNLDLERIYTVGWSNGGFMAYKLACQLSHRIAAVAVVGGALSTNTLAECNPHRPVPILHIHGTRASWVPIEGAIGWESVDQTLNFWISFNACEKVEITTLEDLDLTDDLSVEKITYSDCTDNSNVIYFKRIGGGNYWPTARSGLFTEEEVWNFFKDYRLTPSSYESDK